MSGEVYVGLDGHVYIRLLGCSCGVARSACRKIRSMLSGRRDEASDESGASRGSEHRRAPGPQARAIEVRGEGGLLAHAWWLGMAVRRPEALAGEAIVSGDARAEKALNRRASLLAREMRARFEHEAARSYVYVLRDARLVIDTIEMLEYAVPGRPAQWAGSIPGRQGRDHTIRRRPRQVYRNR